MNSNFPYNPPKIILETERLLLRTWKEEDIPKMAEISSDPIVMEHFPEMGNIESTKKLMAHIQQLDIEYGFSLYAVEIKTTHEFIGFVGLNIPYFEIPNFKPCGLPVVEIGWRIAAKYWGKGYATEAAKAVLKYAFTELNLEEIVSFTVVANLRSRRVMEKIGLRYDEKDG